MSSGHFKDQYKVQQGLEWYMTHVGYQLSLTAGRPRIDLEGKKVGSVTPKEAMEAEAKAQEGFAAIKRSREVQSMLTRPVAFGDSPVPRMVTAPTMRQVPLPEDVEPFFAKIEKRLAYARKIITDRGLDPDMITALFVQALHQMCIAAGEAMDHFDPPRTADLDKSEDAA
jgi:hypothetical protein